MPSISWKPRLKVNKNFFPSREQPSRQELFSTGERPSGSKLTQKRYKEETDQTPDKVETSL